MSVADYTHQLLLYLLSQHEEKVPIWSPTREKVVFEHVMKEEQPHENHAIPDTSLPVECGDTDNQNKANEVNNDSFSVTRWNYFLLHSILSMERGILRKVGCYLLLPQLVNSM